MHSYAWWPTVIVLAVATFTDLRSRRIPNWLVLPFLLAGIVVSAWLHGWNGVGQSFGGLALGVLIFGIFFWMGGMGAGDVKLCAAIGAWIGPNQLFIALVITAMAGGIMVLCWYVFGRFLKGFFMETADLLRGRKERALHSDPEMAIPALLKRKMPYAPAIAIGTLMSFFSH